MAPLPKCMIDINSVPQQAFASSEQPVLNESLSASTLHVT